MFYATYCTLVATVILFFWSALYHFLVFKILTLPFKFFFDSLYLCLLVIISQPNWLPYFEGNLLCNYLLPSATNTSIFLILTVIKFRRQKFPSIFPQFWYLLSPLLVCQGFSLQDFLHRGFVLFIVNLSSLSLHTSFIFRLSTVLQCIAQFS